MSQDSQSACCAGLSSHFVPFHPVFSPFSISKSPNSGDAVNLRRVAEHNHQDVVTLALLLQRLIREEQRERETLALVQPQGVDMP